jgi:hypothetical protein
MVMCVAALAAHAIVLYRADIRPPQAVFTEGSSVLASTWTPFDT